MEDEDFFDEEKAIAELLNAGVLFANCRKYVCEITGKVEKPTIVLFVLCNDLFMWACADAETVTLDELPALYQAWKQNNVWGSSLWCIRKRKQRPHVPADIHMRNDGIDMDALYKEIGI